MMESTCSSIELDWAEHSNSTWCQKDCDNVAIRDLVQSMYELLVQNKEVHLIPTTLSSYNDVQLLPSFQYECASQAELHSYITMLLSSQLELAREVCSSTQFFIILKQKLLILKRIYYALTSKYHDKEKEDQSSTESLSTTPLLLVSRESISGSQALLEIGVKTGLSLLFSLLQQNWQVSDILGIPSLCNSVLETTVELILKLPPLCLSNDLHLTTLGITSLEQVAAFLKNAVLHESAADVKGKLLSCEILLLLALQRGSLRYLLEWIDMGLSVSCSEKDNLYSKLFNKAVVQLNSGNSHLNTDKEEIDVVEINIYETSLLLMEVLTSMAIDYGGAYYISDTINSELNNGKSDVFVWGSNSSHQLAEGNQEKILLPVKSKIFSQVQQVIDYYILELLYNIPRKQETDGFDEPGN